MTKAVSAREAALEWQVTLWSGEVTADERSAFERWRAASPEHEHAWQQVAQVGLRLQGVPDQLARTVLRPAPTSRSRRKVLAGAGTAVGLAALGGVLATRANRADLQTARGERRTLTLPDGTSLVLAPDTAVDIAYDAAARTLHLRRGEVLVTSGHDPAGRPLAVATDHGHARALGTRFTVQRTDARTRVQVFEGAVAAVPARDADQGVTLAARQQVFMTTLGVSTPVSVDPLATAWSRGLLVAERRRLADLLAELAAERPGLLRCDPAVADLGVSGVYRLDDPDATLDALAAGLPIRVRRFTRWWVEVGPR